MRTKRGSIVEVAVVSAREWEGGMRLTRSWEGGDGAAWFARLWRREIGAVKTMCNEKQGRKSERWIFSRWIFTIHLDITLIPCQIERKTA